jgi:DNA polymerase-4/protein ImuB
VKILCILLPHFPLKCETLRNPDIGDCRMLVVCGAGSRKVVLDCSPEIEGIRKDMPLHRALSLNNGVEILQADLPFYRSAFNRILDSLEMISPLVEGPDLGTAYLGIDGLHLIYPDDDSLIAAVREVLPEVFAARVGIADGKFPAYLAALYSPPGSHMVLNGDIRFTNGLPCDVLPIPMKSRNKLREFGINTLGQLAAFPLGPLQSQFGPEGRRIRELARGIDDTPLYPRKAGEIIEESAVLSSVTISIDTLLAAMEPLVSRIFTRLSLTGKGIQSLTLWTRGYDAEHWERTIRFKEPAMDSKKTLSRMKRVLEDYPQPGPVEQTGIRVTRLGYPRGKQNSLFAEIRGRSHLMEDIRQLELRQGNPQVFRIKEVEPWSRIPERRYALIPTGR